MLFCPPAIDRRMHGALSLMPEWGTVVLRIVWFAGMGVYAVASDLRGDLWRKKARRNFGLCEECGYDLRAGHARCPECGAEVPSSSKGG